MLDLPPLLRAREVTDDPLHTAARTAAAGCDAGLVFWRPSDTDAEAALVLAPEVPLKQAVAMVAVAANGLADAVGVLAPPETALHLEWPATVRVEGARVGALRAVCDTDDPDAVPGWLVVGFSVALARGGDAEPGLHPETTDLASEGAQIAAATLVSTWARHTLSWIARWEDAGMAPVHRDWSGRAWRQGRDLAVAAGDVRRQGTFLGLDETGSLLLRTDAGTEILPLTLMLEPPP